MEVKVNTKYTYELFRDFVAFQLFPGKWNRVLRILYPILLAALVALTVYIYIAEGFNIAAILTAMAALILGASYLGRRFGGIKKRYRAAGKKYDKPNQYTFLPDRLELITWMNDGGRQKGELPYRYLNRAYETKKYLYLFIEKSQALVVAREDFAPGDCAAVVELLRKALGKKYVVCI